ncbi:MAG TPA: type II toxin-antitoxin system VapC family toxin [Candidatus Avipropionibacterium avicola]|uniref:Ribonuclease VapC n=1 Tax=Candidatus Avipropionibacterium avicola TaxID=2840701 RepID=A0A9D1H0Z5_9ACTN|nr:type II toxin-antitoxin system VapC family toxin [Candidatus Avipropionibacterium avicola]
MIILDTNVLSELMRGEDEGDSTVLAWVRGLADQPVTTVLNRAEILAGVVLLPPGKRRDRLQMRATLTLDRIGVCLPLVPECALTYADVVATRRAAGRPIGAMDALIASVAITSGADLATRDSAGFDGLGITVIDPWRA